MNLSKNKPEETSDWDKIKDFVGGANKKTKHPLIQEAERMQQRQPEHFDDGGMVDPNAMPLNMGPTAPNIQAPPPSLPPDPNKPYEDKASQVLGGLDPAKISSLLENLRQQSNKSQIGAGIAGLGDAIASVGGENPGHMKNAEEAIRGNFDRGLKAPELLANAGKERYQMGQTLQDNDQNSPATQHARDTYAPLAKRMGLDISHASLKFIGDLVGKTVDQLKNEAQEKEAKAIHEQTATFQGTDLALRKKAEEATERDRQEHQTMDAAEALDKRDVGQKIKDYIHPSASTKFLQSKVAGVSFPPDVVSYAQKHGITPEQAQQIKMKRTGQK